MNNALWLTCGHKTFGVKWLFEHPATHQLLVSVDTNAARSPKRFIPPTVANNTEKKTDTTINKYDRL